MNVPSFQLQKCSALKLTEDSPVDPGIIDGLTWLKSAVANDWDDLDERVERDIVLQKQEEAETKARKKAEREAKKAKRLKEEAEAEAAAAAAAAGVGEVVPLQQAGSSGVLKSHDVNQPAQEGVMIKEAGAGSMGALTPGGILSQTWNPISVTLTHLASRI